MDALQLREARTVLGDLMIGRVFRGMAAEEFALALSCERTARPHEGRERLDRAAHLEWMAERAEHGEIGFGGRFNRCGYVPREAIGSGQVATATPITGLKPS